MISYKYSTIVKAWGLASRLWWHAEGVWSLKTAVVTVSYFLKLKPSVLQPLLVFISCPEQQTTVAPCSCSKRHNWATIFGFSLEWGNYTTNMTPFTVDSISPPVSHPPVGWVWWAVDVTGTCSLLCQKTYSNCSICALWIIHFICIILCRPTYHFIHVSPSG